MKSIQNVIREACAAKKERDLKRGIKNRPVRAMVAGIPNVGKSTFINTYAGKASTKTGNKPGVTRGKQWIRLNKEVELLDTPGILWPKFEDEMVGSAAGLHRSHPGRDSECGGAFVAASVYEGRVSGYAEQPLRNNGRWFRRKASGRRSPKSRGCMKKGDELDYGRATNLLFDDFRSGRLGRITLEKPVTHTEDTK